MATPPARSEIHEPPRLSGSRNFEQLDVLLSEAAKRHKIRNFLRLCIGAQAGIPGHELIQFRFVKCARLNPSDRAVYFRQVACECLNFCVAEVISSLKFRQRWRRTRRKLRDGCSMAVGGSRGMTSHVTRSDSFTESWPLAWPGGSKLGSCDFTNRSSSGHPVRRATASRKRTAIWSVAAIADVNVSDDAMPSTYRMSWPVSSSSCMNVPSGQTGGVL